VAVSILIATYRYALGGKIDDGVIFPRFSLIIRYTRIRLQGDIKPVNNSMAVVARA